MINTAVCLVIGFCLAYMTTRGPWILRKPLKIISLVPLIAPPYLFALSLIILFGRNGLVTRALDLHWELYGFGGVVISQTPGLHPAGLHDDRKHADVAQPQPRGERL